MISRLVTHEATIAATALMSGALLGNAADVIENIPAGALGALGFAALVWRLLKDNTADARIRESYERLLGAERERADRLTKRLEQLEQDGPDE